VPTPAGFSRRDIQQHADTMAATPGSGEHDARLRDVVSAAVPAVAEAVRTDPAWPALRASLRHIENNGGDPQAELTAAADRRPLRGVDSAARVLQGAEVEDEAETTDNTVVRFAVVDAAQGSRCADKASFLFDFPETGLQR